MLKWIKLDSGSDPRSPPTPTTEPIGSLLQFQFSTEKRDFVRVHFVCLFVCLGAKWQPIALAVRFFERKAARASSKVELQKVNYKQQKRRADKGASSFSTPTKSDSIQLDSVQLDFISLTSNSIQGARLSTSARTPLERSAPLAVHKPRERIYKPPLPSCSPISAPSVGGQEGERMDPRALELATNN